MSSSHHPKAGEMGSSPLEGEAELLTIQYCYQWSCPLDRSLLLHTAVPGKTWRDMGEQSLLETRFL